MNSDEILIIQYPYTMSQQRVDTLREQILKQKESGVILLPNLCTVVTKPKEVDIQVEVKKDDGPVMHCFSCKRCDPYGPNVPEKHGHCLMKSEVVAFDTVACDNYIANDAKEVIDKYGNAIINSDEFKKMIKDDKEE